MKFKFHFKMVFVHHYSFTIRRVGPYLVSITMHTRVKIFWSSILMIIIHKVLSRFIFCLVRCFIINPKNLLEVITINTFKPRLKACQFENVVCIFHNLFMKYSYSHILWKNKIQWHSFKYNFSYTYIYIYFFNLE